MTLRTGAVSGAALAAVSVLTWQTVVGNISVTAVVVAATTAAVVLVYCQMRSRRAAAKARQTNLHELEKYQSYYKLLSSWMVLRNKGRVLSDYFEDRSFRSVAIYGLGRLGICLYEELSGSSVDVKYAIDVNAADFSYLDLEVVSPESQLGTVDAIIVTPFFEYKRIVEELRDRTSCNIVNLADVVASM